MTDPVDPSRAHAHAILALVEATQYTTYNGKVTDPDELLSYPHLIVRSAYGVRALTALVGRSATLTTVTDVVAVGRDPDEVMAALDRVAAQLVGAQPTITGRQCGDIADVTQPGVPPLEDKTLLTPDGQPTYRSVGSFELVSTPTS